MIEKQISNPLTLKRYRDFKKIKRSVVSVWLFIFILFLSLSAEFWANSRPIVMSWQGNIYFPVFNEYHPSTFGQTEDLVTNYRILSSEFAAADWALWPIVKWDPLESNKNVETYPAPPSSDNWMGTDDRGRDVMARLIYGFRYSISYAMVVWLLAYALGIAIGAAMGYLGGWVDMIGQRIVETFESKNLLIILTILISIYGASLPLLIVVSTLFGWMGISTYSRAEFLKLRRREFIEGARASGAGHLRIMFKHLLPNSLSPVITFSPFAISSGIAALAGLDYLGFGLPPPTPSWGELLNQAQNHFVVAWWLAVFPSAALCFSLIVLNLIGAGVREAFDPRKAS